VVEHLVKLVFGTEQITIGVDKPTQRSNLTLELANPGDGVESLVAVLDALRNAVDANIEVGPHFRSPAV